VVDRTVAINEVANCTLESLIVVRRPRSGRSFHGSKAPDAGLHS